MNNATTIAITKAVSSKNAKTAREGLTPGAHAVDVTVRVQGMLTVGADTSKTPTCSIPLKETLALFVKKSGMMREHAMRIMEESMTEAIAASGKGAGAVEGVEDIANAMKRVTAFTESLPKTPVKGRVTFKGTMSEIATQIAAG